ncbi:MAG: SPASM domain-containing protein, partial [Chloroflexales bacterium]|nr:SPASM domain-containing protein [Chloroflexales bacterium]
VITHEGRVAQCQMALGQSQEASPGTDLIALMAAGAVHNVSVDEKEGCRDCAWRYRCAGGCPILTLRATGRTDVRSPNCGIYQALLPATLRLEGLRILAANGVYR